MKGKLAKIVQYLTFCSLPVISACSGLSWKGYVSADLNNDGIKERVSAVQQGQDSTIKIDYEFGSVTIFTVPDQKEVYNIKVGDHNWDGLSDIEIVCKSQSFSGQGSSNRYLLYNQGSYDNNFMFSESEPVR